MKHASRTRRRPLPTPRPRLALSGLVLLGLSALLGACGKKEKTYTIDDVRERSSASSSPTSSLSSDQRFGRATAGPHASAGDPGGREWTWTTPEGWTEEPPAEMRKGSWKVPGSPDAECSLVVLPGAAGGLVENVNRWRKQMGLPPEEDAAVQNLPDGEILGRPAKEVVLDGAYAGMGGSAPLEHAKMVGLILELPMAALFLKMVGPADVIAQERAHFDALARSITWAPMASASSAPSDLPPGHPALPGGTGEMPPAGEGDSGLHWDAPPSWLPQPAKPMREVTYVPKDTSDTECYVTVLNGDGGGLDMNLNRWRGQMGQPPLTSAEIQALPRLTANGMEGVLVTIDGSYTPGMGQGGEKIDPAEMLGFVLLRPDSAIFVKLTGPADVVKGQKPNFETFCRSLSW